MFELTNSKRDLPHMVLIIFSPISSHVKQKERGKCNNEAPTLALGGACAAPRRAEKLGIKK